MNAVILGGMSPRHRVWVQQLAEALQPSFAEVRVLEYEHWDRENVEMDVEREITRASQLVEGLSDYVLVAKSIGTVVGTLAHARGLLYPRRCVFMGFPLKVVETELPELAMPMLSLPPTIFLHNDHDPLGSAERVSEYIAAHAPRAYAFRTLPGSTHDYVDFGLIAQLAQSGLSGN